MPTLINNLKNVGSPRNPVSPTEGRAALSHNLEVFKGQYDDFNVALSRFNTKIEISLKTTEERKRIREEMAVDYPHIDWKTPTAPRLFNKGTQGLGKTRFINGEDGLFHTIDIYSDIRKLLATTPTHKLADEFRRDFEANSQGRTIYHVRGRGENVVIDYDEVTNLAIESDTETMCQTPDLITNFVESGLDVTKEWCYAKPSDDGHSRGCPYKHGCHWLEQAGKIATADVLVGTHDLLYSPIQTRPKFDVVFVDEFIGFSRLVRSVELPFAGKHGFNSHVEFTDEQLEDETEPVKEAMQVLNFQALQTELTEAFEKAKWNGDLYTALKESSFNRKHAKSAASFLTRRFRITGALDTFTPTITQHKSNPAVFQQEAIKHLETLPIRPYYKIGLVIQRVLDELNEKIYDNTPDDTPKRCQNLRVASYDTTKGPVDLIRMEYWQQSKLLNQKSIAVIYADGTGSETMAKLVFGKQLVTKSINVRRNQITRYVHRSGCNKTNLDPSKDEVQQVKLHQLQQSLERDKCDSVISIKDTTEYMSKRYGGIYTFAFKNKLHLGSLRGTNIIKDKENLAIIGKLVPGNISDVENTASAIAIFQKQYFHRIPLPDGAEEHAREQRIDIDTVSGEWQFATRSLEDIRGNIALLKVVTHPDELGREVLYQITNAEIVQAVDRIRGVNATQTKTVTVIANIHLTEMPIDEIVSFQSYVKRGTTRVNWTVNEYAFCPLSPNVYVDFIKYQQYLEDVNVTILSDGRVIESVFNGSDNPKRLVERELKEYRDIIRTKTRSEDKSIYSPNVYDFMEETGIPVRFHILGKSALNSLTNVYVFEMKST